MTDYFEIQKIKQLHGGLALAFGCFDILHQGHLNLFARATSESDLPLCIGLLNDRTVRAMKGADRPVHHEDLRCRYVNDCENIEKAFVLSIEGDFENYRTVYHLTEQDRLLWCYALYALDILRPTVFFYSSDFKMTYAILQFFEDRGIDARIIPYTEGISSSKLIAERKRGEQI